MPSVGRAIAILLVTLASFSVQRSACCSDEIPDLIQRLGQQDLKQRVKAAIALRRLGGVKVRRALQLALAPAEFRQRRQLTPELRREIATHIRRLGHRNYTVRVQASRALIRLRYAAVSRIHQATKSHCLETKARAGAILEALIPPRKSAETPDYRRVELALLLGVLGDRSSIPALRHALNTGNLQLALTAAYALRALLGRGPPLTAYSWERTRRQELLRWNLLLANTGGSRSKEVFSLAALRTYPARLRLRSRSKLAFRFNNTANLVLTAKTQSSYRLKVRRLVPLILERQYSKRRFAQGRLANKPAPSNTAWSQQRLRLEFEPAGSGLKLQLNGAPLKRAYPGAGCTLHSLGAVVGLGLPGGEYRFRQQRPLSAAYARRIAAVLFSSNWPTSEMLAGSGSLTYLGRKGSSQLFYLTLSITAQQTRGKQRYELRFQLQGQLTFRRGDSSIIAFELAGPAWKLRPGGAYAWVGEMQFNCSFISGAGEPPK